MKKATSTLLSITLAATLLAGCSTSDSENKAETTETTQAAETKQQSPEAEAIDASSIDNKHLDVEYAGPFSAQKLDIYLPNEGEGPFPVIVAIHGGGFMRGDKTGPDIAPMLEGVNRGYAVVSVNYRLSGEALFPSAISDVKAAIRYVKANAEEYNLDPEKVAAWGGSAGGNLAALAGTSGDEDSLNGRHTENLEYSSEVQAVVDWYGQIDFLKLDEQFEESGITPKMGKRNRDESPESKYIGGNITEKVEEVKKANPATYITENDPAFFIQHGTADPNVPTQQSIDFAEKLTAVLGEQKVELTLIDGAVHGGEPFNSEENLEKVFDFLNQELK
ncbi:alpha/beta hydrolase [Microbacterium sp. APC 3898]|uniref:Alpha/beta hydrolase n=1 Tax=Planococcus notacanthi TaxID=3035188 RepID=A0ABT7ZJZ3_9BACL|nr:MULTISPECIES: alpha/beta hydrolase [Terrabacteria group]MDN3427476.1 alpha/beta hydrolase [Planococcus sp. APC 4016]MDN3436826.1 alpha/beta hydrolase [Planococcus sp. APC 3900]MDN3499027.1 alpha/beta hydrolase [Microbacterium sp. APC 3898]